MTETAYSHINDLILSSRSSFSLPSTPLEGLRIVQTANFLFTVKFEKLLSRNNSSLADVVFTFTIISYSCALRIEAKEPGQCTRADNSCNVTHKFKWWKDNWNIFLSTIGGPRQTKSAKIEQEDRKICGPFWYWTKRRNVNPNHIRRKIEHRRETVWDQVVYGKESFKTIGSLVLQKIPIQQNEVPGILKNAFLLHNVSAGEKND